MANFRIGCFAVTLCVAFVTVTSTTLEIFDGTYYGIEDVGNVTSIQVSQYSGNESSPDDNLNVQPVSPESGRDSRRRGGGSTHRRGHHRGRHGHHGDEAPEGHNNVGSQFMRGDLMASWTDEQRLIQICARIQSHRSERGRHHGGMLAAKLRQMEAQDRQQITDMWNSRMQAMQRCCGQNTIDRKLQCVNEMRTARYERVCRGEEPLCPWTRYGQTPDNSFAESVPSITNTTNTCCARQGAERLQCFVEAKHYYRQRLIAFMSSRHSQSHRGGPPHHHDRRRGRPDDRSDGRQSRPGAGRRPRPDASVRL